MDRPSLFDEERDSAFEPNQADAQFLDVVAAGLPPVLVHRRFLVGRAGDAQRLGIADQVQYLRDVVDAHVVERAAGRILLLHERRRAVAIDKRAAAAAVGAGFRVVNLAQHPSVDQRLGGFGFFAEKHALLHVKHLAGALARGDHRLGVGIGPRQRLFAIHILAGFHRGDGDRGVEVVVQADIDRLDFLDGQQIAEVGEHFLDSVHAGDAARFGLVDVADGDDLGVGNFGVALQMRFADLPRADDADFDFRGHGGSFEVCECARNAPVWALANFAFEDLEESRAIRKSKAFIRSGTSCARANRNRAARATSRRDPSRDLAGCASRPVQSKSILDYPFIAARS
ncbi:MAG: hypothetical protein BWZ10_01061 [candidate division BRC1 bacterium ADurb.BinA364]|nr:MAG: hypothetical protein BWZ10_01061 [candidate division BRC1 bacterium ADurb.BinA364]